MLTGKLTFNAVAVKHIEVDKIKKTALISLDKSNALEGDKVDEFVDHPLQGEVVGIGTNVEEGGTCKIGDIVLLKISEYGQKPYVLNDKGTIYWVYNEGDILLVRKPNEQFMISAANADMTEEVEVKGGE